MTERWTRGEAQSSVLFLQGGATSGTVLWRMVLPEGEQETDRFGPLVSLSGDTVHHSCSSLPKRDRQS
jgi:hypothetical protein